MNTPKRHPSVILATCVVPWTGQFKLDEKAFRAEIRDLAANLTSYLYLFGTAGEGYAVSDSQFEQIARVFFEEASDVKAEPMLGIISLSLSTVLERIDRGRGWGFRRFQLSLPSWGALNEREVRLFFQETCGRFRDCEFMHYNNESRTKRLVTANEYKHLAAEHPNLVATKNMKDDVAFLSALHEKAPQLQHFLSEFGYLWLRDRFECGFLVSLAITNPQRARELFALRGAALRKLEPGLRAASDALFKAVGEPIYIDAAYDKLLYKLRQPAFPLRLLPPYISMAESVRERYWQALERLAPSWLPNPV